MMQALASMPHSTTAVESLLSYGLRTVTSRLSVCTHMAWRRAGQVRVARACLPMRHGGGAGPTPSGRRSGQWDARLVAVRQPDGRARADVVRDAADIDELNGRRRLRVRLDAPLLRPQPERVRNRQARGYLHRAAARGQAVRAVREHAPHAAMLQSKGMPRKHLQQVHVCAAARCPWGLCRTVNAL